MSSNLFSSTNITVTFGSLSRASEGGYLLTNGARQSTSWTIIDGNEANHWQIKNGVLSPTSKGDAEDLKLGTYELRATNNSTTYKINIEIDPYSYDVASVEELKVLTNWLDANAKSQTNKIYCRPENEGGHFGTPGTGELHYIVGNRQLNNSFTGTLIDPNEGASNQLLSKDARASFSGGHLLIGSRDPNNRARIQCELHFIGLSNLHFKDLIFNNITSTPGAHYRPESNKYITNATNTAPVTLTIPNHDTVTGSVLTVKDTKGMTELNDNNYKVTVINQDRISLDDVDGTNFSPYIEGGYINGLSTGNNGNTHMLRIRATGTFPTQPNVIIQDCRFSGSDLTTDPRHWLVAVRADYANNLIIEECSFQGINNGPLIGNVNRSVVRRCDMSKCFGDYIAYRGTGSALDTIDGKMRIEVHDNYIYDHADSIHWAAFHSDALQIGTQSDKSGYNFAILRNRIHLAPKNGGYSQGIYLDDTPQEVTLRGLIEGNIIAISSVWALAFWVTADEEITCRGNTIVKTSTGLPGEATIGLNAENNIKITNNIAGGIRELGPKTYTETDNYIINHFSTDKGLKSSYPEIFNGPFSWSDELGWTFMINNTDAYSMATSLESVFTVKDHLKDQNVGWEANFAPPQNPTQLQAQ